MHLCQPGGGASCGACCGLYNFRDHSRAALTHELDRHTAALENVPKTREAYRAAALELAKGQAAPAYPDVRVCPLLGFVSENRVGCLAHPLVTGGPDLRDCGVYTAAICESFECPSFIWFTDSQKRLIRAACPDWYLYGLVVTDVEFVRGCLRLLAQQVGEEVAPEKVIDRPLALQAIANLFALKESAPGRDEGGIFGRFHPASDGEPVLRQIDYSALGAQAAPEDDVVLCLGYSPLSAEQLDQARRIVREGIVAVAAALTPSEQSDVRNPA